MYILGSICYFIKPQISTVDVKLMSDHVFCWWGISAVREKIHSWTGLLQLSEVR